ncbi:hypothetical protein Hanom_Chr03g00183891 [Helianthus anomalus]
MKMDTLRTKLHGSLIDEDGFEGTSDLRPCLLTLRVLVSSNSLNSSV